MIKIKKDYSLKFILLSIAFAFFLNNAVYGIDISNNKTSLRIPIDKSTYERMYFVQESEGIRRKLVSDQRTVEFSSGRIDIENLGRPDVVFPVASFSNARTLFPVTDAAPEIMELIRSLGISDLSVALDDLVLNAIEHQYGPPGAVNVKIEIFRNGKIVKITIQQPSSGKDARNRLDINKRGFDLRGPNYLIDVQERASSSAFLRRGGAFRVIGDLIRFNSACLIYKIGREEPFPIETSLYVATRKLSLEKLKQAILSKGLQTSL